MISGYTDRLDKELSNISDNRSVLDVRKERIYSTWIGASLLSSMDTFHQLCITRDEYMKYGDDIVLRKCLL